MTSTHGNRAALREASGNPPWIRAGAKYLSPSVDNPECDKCADNADKQDRQTQRRPEQSSPAEERHGTGQHGQAGHTEPGKAWTRRRRQRGLGYHHRVGGHQDDKRRTCRLRKRGTRTAEGPRPETVVSVCAFPKGEPQWKTIWGTRETISMYQNACVCVCPTLDKGFSTTISPQAGGRSAIASLLPTKTLAIGSETRPDPSGVPAFNTLTPLVHPAAVRCFHGPSCYHPQAHCSLTADLQPR